MSGTPYFVSGVVARELDGGKVQVSNPIGVALARDVAEAKWIWSDACLENYPASEGWSHVGVEAIPLDEAIAVRDAVVGHSAEDPGFTWVVTNGGDEAASDGPESPR